MNVQQRIICDLKFMKPKYIVVIILFVVAGFTIWIGYKRGGDIRADKNIPQAIRNSADKYVISKVGQDFFNKYISRKSSTYYKGIDCNSCSNYLHESHYLMAYSLKIPNDSQTRGLIEFVVDTNGNVITEREPFGIPNCIQDPAECVFLSKDQAIKIAENANFKKGIEQWKVEFTWGSKEKTYLWGIQNTLYNNQMEGTEGGEVMAIDANSGKIIYTNSWSAIP